MILYFLLIIGFLVVAAFVLVYFKDVLPLMHYGAIWQPSPISAIRKLLEMAEVKPGDQVYDLGSGDGRVLIATAKEFEAQATGIEINPFLVLYSRLRVLTQRLGKQVKVVWADMFEVDIGAADVLIIFQREETNERLKEKLAKEMKKGARLVCYLWEMEGWKPVKFDPSLDIYIYQI